VLTPCACFAPVELPPPEPPTHDLPPIGAQLPAVPPGRQLLILDTPGDHAQVTRVSGTATGYDTDGDTVITSVARDLCTTPCTYDLRPGTHTLAFTSTEQPERSDTLKVQLGGDPLVVRHVPEENTGQWGPLAEGLLEIGGVSILPVGTAFTAIGLASDGSVGSPPPVFKDVGLAILAVSGACIVGGLVAGYAGRGEHRPAATTEWTLASSTSPAIVGPDVAPTAVPPPQAPDADVTSKLHKLDDLKAQKVITDEEYQRERQRVLDQAFAPTH